MAGRAQDIMLDSSVIIAHFRGKLDLFQLVIHFERVEGLALIKW